MIDLHSHILWNVDDGPRTMEQTLKMLSIAVEEGITGIVATSHYQHPLYSVLYNEIQIKVNILQMELIKNNIPITIYTGHEVRLSSNIISLYKSMQIHTLANSKYLLLELPSSSVPLYTTYVIEQLLNEGLVPIIAHPERNSAILESPEILEKLVRNGALAQVTAGSIGGSFGRKIQKFSLKLVQANLVHLYGSDVHNLQNRPLLFEKGLFMLEKKKLLDIVDLFITNNEHIINNEPIIVSEPESLPKRKIFFFNQRVF